MKKVIYLIMFSIFLAIPSIVKADTTYYSCDVSNLARLQKLATNIVSSYDYQEAFDKNTSFGSVTFTLRLTNLDKKLYIVNRDTGTRYDYTSNELVFSNISAGQTLHYEVYANDYGCNGSYLMTIYVNIPYYNKYYTDELCKNFQGYKLCGKWNNVEMSYEEFKNAVSSYNTNDDNNDDQEKEESKNFNDIFVEIVDYLDKNKMPIFGTTIIASAGLIIVLKIFNRKEKLNLK